MKRLLAGLLVAAVLLLVAAVIILHRPIYSLRFHVVQSGSMEPAISRGSLILTKALPPSQYQEGQVIAFRAPTIRQQVVVHRLTGIAPNEFGTVVATTKGDANTNGDPWTISLGAILGKSVVVIPWLGYLLAMVSTKLGFLTVASLFFIWVAWEWRVLLRRSPQP